MPKSALTLTVLLFLVLNNVWETLAHFCFKKASAAMAGFSIDHPQHVFMHVGHVLREPYLWLGLLAVGLFFLTWVTVLSKVDLSLAMPIASLSYVLVAVASVVFLREEISVLRWAGIVLIFLGVVMVSLSGPKDEGSKA